MDETYVNIKGEWWYYYRAVDKNGDVVDLYLSKKCDENAVEVFLRKAIGSSANSLLTLHQINALLWFSGVLMLSLIDVVDIKYLNNIVEQSHRPIKQKMVQALGWKSETGVLATMAGQETWTMIKRGQIIDKESLPVWKRFSRSLRNRASNSARSYRT